MAADDATARFLAKYGVTKLAEQWDLAPEVCRTLSKLDIRSFFPVQAVAIPKILASDSDRVTDICISAPTGSGKTLTYVVPIVQRLLPRVVCRVRALIVLPSRDLAVQVHEIVQQFCQDTPLKCGLAIGQSNFALEQSALVGDISEDKVSATTDGGHSLVDILVATPGRLVDHLEQTPGFTLQHLQIMIVDEADRLLNQSYQDWIPKVYASVFNGQEVDDEGLTLDVGVTCRRQDSINRRRIRTPLTRVLLSATLTRNPRKLAAIGMSNAELTKIGRIDDPLADNAKQGTAGDSDDDDGEE
ncbi:ATP-dependent RNA helicase DDX27, partial [Phytophthora palmivora]